MIIAALASAPGKGGISVIRVSGENCHNIVIDNFFPTIKKHNKNLKYSYLYFGKFFENLISNSSNSIIIDEVMIAFFKKGKSYTGDESLEISCHGSPLIVTKILTELYNTGKIREAEAGEFTRERFLNGKIDLVQAESVIDLINSESEMSLKASNEQLQGYLSDELLKINQKLIDLLSHLELELDFGEEEIDFLSNDKINARFVEAISVIDKFLLSFNTGKKYKEGIKVALVGRVNAGKSSLMNKFLNEERVIVTEIAGTTRDIIEEQIEVNGFLIRLFDTAGLRDTQDIVEKEGIKKSLQAIEDADIVLHIIDASKDDNIDFFSELDIDEKKLILVQNKMDKVEIEIKVEEKSVDKKKNNEIFTSCKTGLGIDDLKNKIIDKALNEDISYHSSVITNLRHFNILRDTKKSLILAQESLLSGQNNEVVILDVRDGLDKLGELTGKSTSLDVINNIFMSFCIGK